MDRDLGPIVLRFVAITDIDETGDFLEANPSLVASSADDAFRRLRDDARASRNAENELAVEAHWKLVKRARKFGVEKALAEHGFVPKHLRALVKALRRLSPHEQTVFEQGGGADYDSLLNKHPDLAQAVRNLRDHFGHDAPSQ